jgi:hypothetical protein
MKISKSEKEIGKKKKGGGGWKGIGGRLDFLNCSWYSPHTAQGAKLLRFDSDKGGSAAQLVSLPSLHSELNSFESAKISLQRSHKQVCSPVYVNVFTP